MSKIKKYPVFDCANNLIGFEAPEKGIKIVVCSKKQADTIIT